MSTPLLDRYREAGYTVTREGSALRVVADHPVSERMREVFKQRKDELLRELALEAENLDDFRHALRLGSLVVCGNCSHFQFCADPAGIGHCGHFNVEALPFVAFSCQGFEASTDPAAPAYLPDPHGSLAVERWLRERAAEDSP